MSCAWLASQIARTKKKAASGLPDAALANAFVNALEREIHAGANHAKIVIWTVHEIPAEITDPADVRS
jgi:hypothetical protein